jgi:hypothetical protein
MFYLRADHQPPTKIDGHVESERSISVLYIFLTANIARWNFNGFILVLNNDCNSLVTKSKIQHCLWVNQSQPLNTILSYVKLPSILSTSFQRPTFTSLHLPFDFQINRFLRCFLIKTVNPYLCNAETNAYVGKAVHKTWVFTCRKCAHIIFLLL